MPKIKPLPGYVLIETLKDQEVTSSGLALPERAQEKPEKGKILAKGEYMVSKEYNLVLYDQIKVDQIVIFHKWSGQDVKDGEKEYKLVKFQDLMAIYG
mgnify:CR=1 FL=1